MANNNSGRDKNEKDLVCSFCGKHQDEVERMIIGPGVNICSECIGLCHDLLSDKPDQPKSARPARRCKPCTHPACGRSGYQHPDPGRDQGRSGSVCDRSGRGKACAGRLGLQPLQAHPQRQGRRRGAAEVQRTAAGSLRRGQDPAGTDSGQNAGRSLRHCRCHHPDRGRLCGRGCGEHSAQADPGSGF